VGVAGELRKKSFLLKFFHSDDPTFLLIVGFIVNTAL
jgi:hypothetical protein